MPPCHLQCSVFLKVFIINNEVLECEKRKDFCSNNVLNHHDRYSFYFLDFLGILLPEVKTSLFIHSIKCPRYKQEERSLDYDNM